MNTRTSKLWLLGPPFAILLTVFVYYAKFYWARQWIDQRFPWVEEHVGRRLSPMVIQETAPPRPGVARPAETPAAMPPPDSLASSGRDSPPRGSSTALPTPRISFLAPNGTLDVPKLAANPVAWPKTVSLKKAMDFPAVVGGKTVGKVRLPPGSAARLVKIQNGKLGLEYQGGGAWLNVEDTDLPERMRF